LPRSRAIAAEAYAGKTFSLGERRYLEIIAPDPAQPRSADVRQLYRIESPRLIGWAAHVEDLDAVMQKLSAAKIAFEPVRPGARKRPSGQVLRWRALSLRDDQGGLLPFFIEWAKDSPHPSTDALAGARLDRFELGSPRPTDLHATVSRLDLDASVAKARETGTPRGADRAQGNALPPGLRPARAAASKFRRTWY
jgi:hypothetical protein